MGFTTQHPVSLIKIRLMTEKDFVPKQLDTLPESGSIGWKAPSNIALVKYWGKKAGQIPANPSISFTLDACATRTTMQFERLSEPAAEVDFDFRFEGRSKPAFKPKIQTFFERILPFAPFLKGYRFIIDSSNSFPHSSGIASSASGMAALALCILEIEKLTDTSLSQDYLLKKASFLARLGSGSACRSIECGLVQWGAHQEIEASSDLYGIHYPYEVHKSFERYHDTILLIHKGQKTVSSSVGHGLMNGHPFAARRFDQAHENLVRLRGILKNGALDEFIEVVESEALTLHAMMMTGSPYFMLMLPNTLEVIHKIWDFRKVTGVPICFTLDAGANVHLLYPEAVKEKAIQFIQDELVAYCENGHYICDRVGTGASKL